ncbi:ABC transporter ATP-binding protein [Marinomonas sp. C2222]|uniref:ABC transporter ATP-binding protein n=1 Tax=Marinomonas sargassi TaxID=2984494 RepID=A0ABT2YU46_9GAMM|nr:ABC transporter ATP-binding protein [Marinomonas sargassi]MCV2403139.1 ABC transporter ATP-binding protein [Marinomonas sargassi]
MQTDAIDLACENICKHFSEFTAVDNVSFTIPQGSFFSILGPSGCGKTTLLRMLAGFESPTSGDILIKNKSVLDVPPNKRPINMVFQHLALFPTMNIEQNIGYGLRRQGVAKAEIAERVAAVLKRVGLPDSGKKRVDQLSGGQRQRIALARCLVLNPTLLLLDEPLGALDLKLREQMKIELKQLQKEFGTTFVYITHDQSEALVMSDQIAVMNQGKFEQVGTPHELYYQPKTAFVASFVGDTNRWSGVVKSSVNQEDHQTQYQVTTNDGLTLDCVSQSSDIPVSSNVDVFVRPEAITVSLSAMDNCLENQLECQVENILFDGAKSQIIAIDKQSGGCITAAMPQTADFMGLKAGDAVYLSFSAKQALSFSEKQGEMNASL